ncbi:MAG: S8 family serine peptidase, partial [Halobacteriota archaeon]|nr:S8 family serine peptidase [Halobacteriota archaeon]
MASSGEVTEKKTFSEAVMTFASESMGPKNPKIDSILSDLIQLQNDDPSEWSAFITLQDIPLSGEKIQVVLVTDKEPESLRKYTGLEIEARYKDQVRVLVPISMIEEISEDPDIHYVRMPLRPHPLVESEGVGVIDADALHAMGINGTGVKVAVIDAGFDDYDSSPDEIWNVVEAVSFTGDITGGGEFHGSACAEIILDVAPNASLYLYNIGDNVDFGNAVDRAISQGVDIISCSLGWVNAGPYDGTGPICDITNTSNASGILFVNSAGNQASKHYEGTFSDSDINGIHEFDGSFDEALNLGTISSGYPITLYLSWDDWVAVDQDYDLYLLDGSLDPVYSSINVQNGSYGQRPREAIEISAPATDSYYVVIHNYSSRGDADLELYSYHNNFAEYGNPASSILIPADAESVFSVGSTNWSNDVLETFSSRGPTNDGRIKPDVCAPDGVTNSFYPSGFYGTSASTPHVAGAAALLLGAEPTLSTTEIRYYLESGSDDLDVIGKDNKTGSGRIDVNSSYLLVLASRGVHNLNTSENFSTIQEAIDDPDTSNSDVLEVDSGTYSENLVVSKSLTLRSSSGDPTDTTIKAADPTEHLINITSGYVNISGFTLEGDTDSNNSGIHLKDIGFSRIINNNISCNYYAI